jgi:hypothetical protein
MLKFDGSVEKLGRCLSASVAAAVLLGIVGFSAWKLGLEAALWGRFWEPNAPWRNCIAIGSWN